MTDQVRSTKHQNLPLLASQACSIGQTLSPNKAYQNKASKASPQDRLTGQMIPFQIAKTVSFDLKNYHSWGFGVLGFWGFGFVKEY